MPITKADRVRRTPSAALPALQIRPAAARDAVPNLPSTSAGSGGADRGQPDVRIRGAAPERPKLPRPNDVATERLAALHRQRGGQTALSPVELLKTLQRLRNEAAAEVESLIALMDAIDADPDFEPYGDEGEPSLGSCENHPTPTGGPYYGYDGVSRSAAGCQLGWAAGNAEDREFCVDLEEDDSHDGVEPDLDEEPSLGSINPTISGSQVGWAQGAGDEREDEHDGSEASGDELEPSLGSFDRLVNQEHAYRQTRGGCHAIMFRNSDAEAKA